jgi:hypothetical protein
MVQIVGWAAPTMPRLSMVGTAHPTKIQQVKLYHAGKPVSRFSALNQA